MTFFITQCPHCGTSFRTGINQLQSADGMLRCGACLEIFVADDNLLPSAELQTVAVQTEEEDILTLDLTDSIPGRITPSISEQPVWEILDELPQRPAQQQQQPPSPELSALHASMEQEAGPDDYRFGAEHLVAVAKADEVLELDWQQPPPRGAVLWPYTVLLVLALLGQFVYQQFDMLSEDSRSRPWLQRACDMFGCQLPQIVDVSAIRSDNLLVRSHPQYSNALNVNMTLHNSASYPQPFPALNLRFSNARNEAIAVRRFMPAEYLPEGLSANTPMPVNAPVQVNLDILDPGTEAVSYEVSFSAISPP